MPNHHTARCPDCGHVETYDFPTDWDGTFPECPVCASTNAEHDFKPFGTRSTHFLAGKEAERLAEARVSGAKAGGDPRSASEIKQFGELAAHIREDISEHRAPEPSRAPVEPMRAAPRQQITGAMAFGRAFRRAEGGSPVELYQRSIGKTPQFVKAKPE